MEIRTAADVVIGGLVVGKATKMRVKVDGHELPIVKLTLRATLDQVSALTRHIAAAQAEADARLAEAEAKTDD